MYPTTDIDILSLLTSRTEDVPAPTAIHSFKANVVDGKIHVTADERYTLKQNMKRNPGILTEDTSFKIGVIIVGGGCGAFYVVMSLREVCLTRIFEVVILGLNGVQSLKHGYKGPITIISKEPYAPIDRCGAFLAANTITLNFK